MAVFCRGSRLVHYPEDNQPKQFVAMDPEMDGNSVGCGSYAVVFGSVNPHWVVKWAHEDRISSTAITRERQIFEYLGQHDGIVKYRRSSDTMEYTEYMEHTQRDIHMGRSGSCWVGSRGIV